MQPAEPPPAPSTRRRLRTLLGDSVVVLLLLIVLAALFAAWRGAQRWSGLDFYQFWVVGQAIELPDAGDVYSERGRSTIGLEFLRRAQEQGSRRQLEVAERRRVLETYSTPFLYTVFGLLSSGDYDRDLAVYRSLSLAAFVLGVLALCRRLRFGWPASLAAIPVLVVGFEPFVSDMRVANVNGIQLGLLALALRLGDARNGTARHLLAGAILGLAVTFKPNLALAAVLLLASWAVSRDHGRLTRAGLGMFAAIVAAFAYSSWKFGTATCWARWLAAATRVPDEIVRLEQGNFSLATALGTGAPFYLTALGTALFVACLRIGRRTDRPAAARDDDDSFPDDALAVAAGCLIALLASPLAWIHYFVLALPAVLLGLRPAGARGARRRGVVLLRRVLAAAALVAMSVRPLVDLGIDRMEHVGVFAALVGSGAAVLLGLVLFDLATRGR